MHKNKPIDKIMIAVVMILIAVIGLANAFQGERPTVSEQENRELATMPEFSISALLDGSYFTDFDTFFSDTFIGRENLVMLSKELDAYKSFSMVYEREFGVIVGPVVPPTSSEPFDETLPTLPPITSKPSTVPSIPTEPSDSTGPSGSESTQPTVIPITLSMLSLKFSAGSTKTLQAWLGEGYTGLSWKVQDDTIAQITKNENDIVTIKGLAEGTTTITATATHQETGETASLSCALEITKPTVAVGDADFLPSGMFIYKGAAYTQSYYSKKASTNLATIYERFAVLFPESRVSVVVAPLASITITDTSVLNKISRQDQILDKIQATITGDVNYVNLKETYLEHKDEYLFLKSDHHWTQRGAYYAYAEFAKSVGITPTPIEDFEVKILTEKYLGSMVSFTKDDRVKEFHDTVEAYMPNKKCTMTILNYQGNLSTFNTCIFTNYKNYLAFIGGDYPYTVINVPDNPQDMTCLVLKDSYGNAFVPYLTEHYGNIIVIDPRHMDIKLLEEFSDTHFTDIIFMYNTSSSNNNAWYNYFYKMIT